MVPLCQKRMLACSKAWVLLLRSSWAAALVVWATRGSLQFCVWCGNPLMLALTAAPVSWPIAPSNDHICSTTIPCCVPVSCNVRSLGGKRVVLAKFLARALWTPVATTSTADRCLPLMQMPIRTLIALPPDCLIAEFLDDNIT